MVMAASSKQSSRWGSFLQQAVAGVESKIDNILVGEDFQKPGASSKSGQAATELESCGQELPRELPRASMTTTNTINDRLQERLARVIAAKNYAVLKNDNHVLSNSPSRAGSPATVGSSPRLSLDQASSDREDPQYLAQSRKEEPQSAIEIDGDCFTNEQAVKDPPVDVLLKNGLEGCSLSIDLNSSSVQKRSTGASQPISEVEPTEKINGYLVKEPVSAKEVAGLEAQFEQQMSEKLLQEDLENSSAQHQEEIHGYIERIDALQAKLMYVSRESVESARKSAASAPSGSTEKKLAEKDEQIALLLEEGQKLSRAELRHMTVIKKLRARTSEIEKERAEVLRHVENVERENSALSERLKSAEAAEKQANEYQKALTQAQKEIEAQITECDEKNIAIAGLKARLSESVSQSKANEAKLARDLLEQERRRVEELENTLMSLKIEKELAAGRTKARIEELQAMNEREAERARVVDVEMRAEQQALESKLEVLRARAEEVSSGMIGDAQAKLLRQIETLQTQYAVARENWQGIEASLASRVTGLEKERDDALKREMDIRRKSREVTLKSKRLEDDFEEVRSGILNAQEQLIERERQLDKLRLRSEEAELALTEAKRNFDLERQIWQSEVQHRIDEERIRWQEELSRAESPVTPYRGLTVEYQGLQNLQARRTSARSITNEQIMERHVSRKSSAQPVRSSGQGTPQREDLASSFMSGGASDTPSFHPEHDEYFENATSPPSPHDMAQDILSISTVGAGPSVQLVERMSAAVRRLECEKVSMREELSRLSEQRDQARAQVVALMQHFEARKDLDRRVQRLKEENEKINARYQTTLEMLGEKSELVEELRADVQDVKDMYRELVERTVK